MPSLPEISPGGAALYMNAKLSEDWLAVLLGLFFFILSLSAFAGADTGHEEAHALWRIRSVLCLGGCKSER